MVDDAGQELHGDVLERQRRAVPELEDEMTGLELHQRGHRRVVEPGIGGLDHGLEFVRADFVADKFGDHRKGDVLIRTVAEIVNFFCGELRPAFRNVKTAVARKARENDVTKAKRGRLAARADIPH